MKTKNRDHDIVPFWLKLIIAFVAFITITICAILYAGIFLVILQ